MNRADTAFSEYLFHEGTNFHAYRYLGAHRENDGGYTFRTWAPNARAVALVGDMTAWEREIPFTRESERGIFSLSLPAGQAADGQKYKLAITGADGLSRLKGDPYAFASEGGAGGASILFESDYEWEDALYLENRRRTVRVRGEGALSIPISIYELHAGSFIRHGDGSPLSYREMAEPLIEYVRMLGFTHVEFLPLAEHPYEPSWGYQICAFYAPTSRLGTPDDLRYLIDRLHRAGIGVIMDWVPAHFPKDAWGLYEFDGQALYEFQGHDRWESHSWGTRFFDLGREEIQCFLVSNALYWLREFHIDGLRVDAVAAMLYRDYDKRAGEWTPNSYGGRESLEGIAFLRKLNETVEREFPDVLMIAEESTAFPGVTAPVSDGGLGFSLKWNMGFSNDLFAYLGKDPIFRRYHHTALSFPMMYAYSERYVLPISHDEVVYGKGSLYTKASGTHEDKLNTLRTTLLFYATFPGKKMIFMGTEFGQRKEWDHRFGIDFHLLAEEAHRDLLHYTSALFNLYLESPPLWECDFSPEGFSWLDVDNADSNAIAYLRRDRCGREIIAVLSFAGIDHYDYRLPVPSVGHYDVIFYSGWDGASYEQAFTATADEGGAHVMMRLPARTGILLRRREDARTLALSHE